jgi:hypothetical protein
VIFFPGGVSSHTQTQPVERTSEAPLPASRRGLPTAPLGYLALGPLPGEVEHPAGASPCKCIIYIYTFDVHICRSHQSHEWDVMGRHGLVHEQVTAHRYPSGSVTQEADSGCAGLLGTHRKCTGGVRYRRYGFADLCHRNRLGSPARVNGYVCCARQPFLYLTGLFSLCGGFQESKLAWLGDRHQGTFVQGIKWDRRAAPRHRAPRRGTQLV